MLGKFGKRGGGGRRGSKRETTPMYAVVQTAGSYHSAIVIDISVTGVRITGEGLPETGSLTEIKIDRLRAFGEVVWSAGRECGINFDVPLGQRDVLFLKSSAARAQQVGLTLDERTALEEWTMGISR